MSSKQRCCSAVGGHTAAALLASRACNGARSKAALGKFLLHHCTSPTHFCRSSAVSGNGASRICA
eukprot:1204846-Prymnesium_polylepis.1